MNNSTWKNKGIVLLSVILLLLVWSTVAKVMAIPIIIPSPVTTFFSFIDVVSSETFGRNLLVTVVRGLESFLIISVSATVFGLLSGFYPSVKAFLTPLLLISKATPVMAVILLAFIWFTSGTVPIFSAFLMAFPVMFIQVESGVHNISKELSEMTKVYGLSFSTKFFHFLLPSMSPFLISGAKSTLSMIWKVVIAAEVLTVPKYGVGSQMQFAQINLETATVLSWTIIAILLTALSDSVFAFLLDRTTSYRKHKAEDEQLAEDTDDH
ncbi:MAG: ABC transporter permease subunit [Sphaerochaetaceae bacterium]|nr:ABC transporter permease subunit [Sphaerochaetaceae bacterium]